jgi:hypothetical protein
MNPKLGFLFVPREFLDENGGGTRREATKETAEEELGPLRKT